MFIGTAGETRRYIFDLGIHTGRLVNGRKDRLSVFIILIRTLQETLIKIIQLRR